MPLFIFFVNKPLTIIPYLLGILLFLVANILSPDMFPLPFIFLFISFSLWYPIVLVYYYVLRNTEDEVLGIQVSRFQKLFFTTVCLQGLAIAVACIFLVYFDRSFGFAAVLLSFGFSVVILICFKFILEAKLVSEGLKRNANLNDLNFNKMYAEIRQLILTKVIEK